MKHFKYYTPITATPYRHSEAYVEIEPCAALKPYIRCFWGSKDIYTQSAGAAAENVVVPDTCMDIIFTVNYTENSLSGCFCGIDDRAFLVNGRKEKSERLSVFAIRFYAWSAVLFAEESMQSCRNFSGDASAYFSWLVRALKQELWEKTAIEEQVLLAETVLLRRMELRREEPVFMEAVAEILSRRGALRIRELARDIHVSDRQMQRVFRENMGVSPKTFASLVRYQNLWRDILAVPGRQIADEVYRLQYTDQAHLCREFKRYHGMTIPQARALAGKSLQFTPRRISY